MSSNEDEERRRSSEERRREEEYNRLKRQELMEKHKRSSYANPVDESRRKADEKQLIEQLRNERLANKERRRQSIVSTDESRKLPQFTVRRKSTESDSPSYDDRSARHKSDAFTYYPHEGVRRSVVDDLAKGGSRRATEHLKAQLLETIGTISPESPFFEERKRSIKGHLYKPTKDANEETAAVLMSSEKVKEERQVKTPEDMKMEEERNRLKRLELMDKHRRSSYVDPVDKASRKADENEMIEKLRNERLANKERRRQSIVSTDESRKLPQFTVRRKSTESESPSYDRRSSRHKSDAFTYYPHEGVRRSVVDDLAKGGSRRATEPLKAQLLEIIGNMSPDSKFHEDKRQSIKGHIPKPKQDETKEIMDELMNGDSFPTPDTQQPTTSKWSPTPESPRRLSPAKPAPAPYKYEEPEPIAGPSRYEEDIVPGTRATLLSPPNKLSPETKPRVPKKKCGVCTTATPETPQRYREYESTEVSTATDALEEKQNDSQMAVSIATNTIKLASTSSAMREERTQEFLNEGWYHNVCCRANDEFSSILESSARQMNIPPHLQQQYRQNVQTIQSIQHMATSGPIICDRCRYSNELVTQHSHPCCPTLAAQTMAQMESAGKQGARPTTAIQCDNVCPTRNRILRTIYKAFKNPLNRIPYKRPSFDPTVPELYRLNISEGSDYQGQPKRVIFDLIDGEIYRPTMATVGTNTHVGIGHSPIVPQMGIVQPGGANKLLFNPSQPQQQCTYTDHPSSYNTGAIVINHPQGDEPPKNPSKIAALKQNLRRHQERIDVYYFDHGNASYYRTTDSPGTIYTELIAERTEHNTAQYWAELFGTIHIAFSLFTAFFLQLYRFVLQSTFRPLTVGFVQLTSDYMIKPLLVLLFNAIIQPILIYLYNIATSFRDLCEPIADAIGFFLREIAVPIRAFRLVEVRQYKNSRPYAEIL